MLIWRSGNNFWDSILTFFGSRSSPFHPVFEIGSLVMFPHTPGWLAFELPGDSISGSNLLCQCWDYRCMLPNVAVDIDPSEELRMPGLPL